MKHHRTSEKARLAKFSGCARPDLGISTVRNLSGNKVRTIGMLFAIALVAGVTALNVIDKQEIESLSFPSKWTNPVTQLQTIIPAQ